MKYFFSLGLVLDSHTYTQITHEMNVAVGSPEECTVTSMHNLKPGVPICPNPVSQSLSIDSEFNIDKITIADVVERAVYPRCGFKSPMHASNKTILAKFILREPPAFVGRQACFEVIDSSIKNDYFQNASK